MNGFINHWYRPQWISSDASSQSYWLSHSCSFNIHLNEWKLTYNYQFMTFCSNHLEELEHLASISKQVSTAQSPLETLTSSRSTSLYGEKSVLITWNINLMGLFSGLEYIGIMAFLQLRGAKTGGESCPKFWNHIKVGEFSYRFDAKTLKKYLPNPYMIYLNVRQALLLDSSKDLVWIMDEELGNWRVDCETKTQPNVKLWNYAIVILNTWKCHH